jgi:hypothetical protein
MTARSFVNWYNAHPDCAALGPQVAEALSGGGSGGDGDGGSGGGDGGGGGGGAARTVVVIGVGNVALDCARILVKGERSANTSALSLLLFDSVCVGAYRCRCCCAQALITRLSAATSSLSGGVHCTRV